MPAQAGRQPAASPSMGQTASWPTVEPTLQLGSPASRRPTARRAGLPARRPARRLPAGGQPGGYHPEGSHNRSQPRSHLRRQYHKNTPIPGKPRKEQKFGKQPGHRAGRPAGQPAAPSQLALGQPASRMTVSWLTVQAGSQPTGWLLAAISPAS